MNSLYNEDEIVRKSTVDIVSKQMNYVYNQDEIVYKSTVNIVSKVKGCKRKRRSKGKNHLKCLNEQRKRKKISISYAPKKKRVAILNVAYIENLGNLVNIKFHNLCRQIHSGWI